MRSTQLGAFAGGARLLDRGVLDQARLAWRLLRDPRVSALKYAIPMLLGAYLVSPVDGIPDFLLGIGQTDDVGMAVLAFLLAIRIIPKLASTDVLNDHLQDMSDGGRGSEPRPNNREGVIDAQFSVRH